jgi:hypothetical protein
VGDRLWFGPESTGRGNPLSSFPLALGLPALASSDPAPAGSLKDDRKMRGSRCRSERRAHDSCPCPTTQAGVLVPQRPNHKNSFAGEGSCSPRLIENTARDEDPLYHLFRLALGSPILASSGPAPAGSLKDDREIRGTAVTRPERPSTL